MGALLEGYSSGGSFEAILKFGGNDHILEGEFGQPPWILDICQNKLSRELRDPLRTCESLALKVLLQQSLIWEFQENSVPLQHPIAKSCDYVAFKKKYQELRKKSFTRRVQTREDKNRRSL